MTSVWGVSAVAMVYSSVNCVCVWSTKKLTMPAYCVAANCNNSQTSPGVTMHELPRNRPAVRRKWIKFIKFKRADFLAAPHHAHLYSEHFSECDFANPMEYRMGFCFEADTMFRYSFKILPDRLKLIRLYSCGSLGQSVSLVFGARVGHSQTTPGITMHELPRNRPAVRRKWIKFIQFKRADFLAGRITPICVASTSVSAISQTPWNTASRS